MNTQSILLALLAIVPIGSLAGQPASTSGDRSVAEVSLSDLDLSTPSGTRLARERLQSMAERLCADGGAARELSAAGAMRACVETTVSGALRRIDALTQTRQTALNSVSLGAGVSLADLDLSTLEGARLARERLDATARRLCHELTRRHDLAYPPDFAACVHDSLSGALAQAEALAAASNTRSARRSAP
jgi:UrcA family protein